MKPIPIRDSAQMPSLQQHGALKVKEVVKSFPTYSQTSIYRHCKKHIGPSHPVDKRRFNRSRPSKITKQDRRSIICSLKKLRETEGSFTSPRLAPESGVAQKNHNRSIRMVLNQEGVNTGVCVKRDFWKEQICMPEKPSSKQSLYPSVICFHLTVLY